jgi:hypothetical protein
MGGVTFSTPLPPRPTLIQAGTLPRMVLLGDVHSQWNRVQPILDHEFPSGRGTALCVGDLVDYPSLKADHQIHFVPGNHENFRTLEAIRRGEKTLAPQYQPLFAGRIARLGGLTVAGLPGVYSPYFFDRPSEAPLKYFTRDGMEALLALNHPIDVLLMHEAPKDVGFEKGGEDLGQPLLTELIRRLKPRLALFGHHHMTFEGRLGDTRILGLDYPKRSYGLLEYDPGTQAIRVMRHEAELVKVSRAVTEYRYPAFSSSAEHAMNQGAVLLFEGDIPLDREQRMREHLETLRRKVETQLSQQLLDRLRQARVADPEMVADNRAGLAVNTVLPFVARYAARLEADPNLPLPERQKIMDGIHAEMTQGVIVQAIPDILMAFQAFLRALGLLGN